MSETKKKQQPDETPECCPESQAETQAGSEEAVQPEQEPVQEENTQPSPEEALKASLAAQEDKYLRLAAEYDNFRKRSQKEKEALWSEAKADTVSAFLPVYDNLERALKQETADEAYKKGVEMTMNQLTEVLKKLGVEVIEAQGQPFDPAFHNAVMHIEDENFGENTVAEVFQSGFKLGEKVIRFAMVKVAN